MQSSPQIRIRSVVLGTLAGACLLAGLAFTGVAVGFQSPVSLLAVVFVGLALGTFRAGSVFDRNTGHVVASAWTCSLPAVVLVLPLLLREEVDLPWPVAAALLAGSALTGVLLVAATRRAFLERERLPFPSAVAITRAVQRTHGRGRLAFWIGLLLGTLSFAVIGGLLPLPTGDGRALLERGTWTPFLELDTWRQWAAGQAWRFRGVPADAVASPLWGEPSVWSFDLGTRLGAATPAALVLVGSVAVLALGFFVGAPGVLLAVIALLVQWVLVPFGAENWSVDAERFPSRVALPLGLALVAGGCVGTAFLGGLRGLRRAPGTHRYRRAGGALRTTAWLFGIVLAGGATFFAWHTYLGAHRAEAVAWQRVDSTTRLPLLTAGPTPRGGDVFQLGGKVPVHAGRLLLDAPLESLLRRRAVERTLALPGGAAVALRFFPSDVPAGDLVLHPGRHYEADRDLAAVEGGVELVATRPGRLLETEDLAVEVRRVVARIPVGPADWVRPYVDVPLPSNLPQDVVFFLPKEATPAECVAGQPLEKWWRCVAGRRVPRGIEVELTFDPALPAATRTAGGQVLRSEGLQARIHARRDGERRLLHVHPVGPGHELWSVVEVPANETLGTPPVALRLGPGILPEGREAIPYRHVLRHDPALSSVPLGDGALWETEGLELAVSYTVERLDLRNEAGDELRVSVPASEAFGVDTIELRLLGSFGEASRAYHVNPVALTAPPAGLKWRVDRSSGEPRVVGAEPFELHGSWGTGLSFTVRVDAGYEPLRPLPRGTGVGLDDLRLGTRLALGPGRVGGNGSDPGAARLYVALTGYAVRVFEEGEERRVQVFDLLWSAMDRELLARALEDPAYTHLETRAADGRVRYVPLHPDHFAAEAGDALDDPALVRMVGGVPLRSMEELDGGRRRLEVEAAAGVRTIELPADVAPGDLLALDDGSGIVVPAALEAGPSPRLAPWMTLALLGAIAVAVWFGLRLAGWFEVLPWIVAGVLALVALAPFSPGFVVGRPSPLSVPLLLALAAVLTAVGAAIDTGRDLRVADSLGARAGGVLGLKVVFCTLGAVGGFFAVWWLARHADTGLGGRALPAALAQRWIEELRTAVALEPSWIVLGGGALVGLLTALTSIAGLPIWIGSAFLLPVAFATTFGAGALLRVLTNRLAGRRFAERTGVSFFTGLMVGELLLGILLAAAIAAHRLQGSVG